MSIQPSYEPECLAGGGAIELAIEARIRSLGEFDVRRVLPVAKRRNGRPVRVFRSHGARDLPGRQGHRRAAASAHRARDDHVSLRRRDHAPRQPRLRATDPAGRSEPDDRRARDRALGARRATTCTITSRLHGIQSWMALPLELEEMEPSFVHYPAATLPELEVDGCAVRVIMGSAFGRDSPVATLFADAVSRGRAARAVRASCCRRARGARRLRRLRSRANRRRRSRGQG